MRRDPFDKQDKRISQDALNYFTDRVGFIEAFQIYLDAPAPDSLKVLVFCGVGGIGKTTLVRKLSQDLHAAKVPLPHTRFDLDTLKDPVQAYREVLVRLRTDLNSQFHIDFPRFDLCLALMLANEGGAAPNLVQVNPTLNSAYQFALALSPLPFTGAVAALGGHITKQGAKHIPGFEGWLRRAGGTEDVIALRKRAQSDDQTLPDELMRRFALDLKAGLPERAGKAVRGALFLDTYERLWVGRAADGSRQSRGLDEWVRTLALYCLHMGVLLVVTGRDRLRWEKDEPDEWEGGLDQHQMGGLSALDAQAFLSKCGIGDDAPAPPTPLQQAILHCADESAAPAAEVSCHTLFLALCAEIVLNTRRQTGPDPSLETFHRIPPGAEARELADRFLKSLHDRPMELWLEELSLTPRFDKEAALTLRGNESRPDAEAAWELLTGFSFATRQPDGFWRLHETMRDALALRVSQDAAHRVHTLLRDHWAARKVASLMFFHRWSLDPAAALEEWRQEHATALKERHIADARRLLTFWADISLDDSDRRVLGDVLWAETHGALGDAFGYTPIVPRVAILTAAVEHYEATIRVWTEEKFPWEWAGIQYEMGSIYWNLPAGSHAANLRQAIFCFQAALRVYAKDKFPRKWVRTQHKLGDTYAFLSTGDRALNLLHAIALFRAALDVCSGARFLEVWADIQVSLGNAYRSLPPDNAYRDLPTGDSTANLQHAINCFQAALRVRTEDEFPLDWARIQHALGNAYNDLPTGDRAANLQQAIAHYQAALNVYTEAKFPSDWAAVELSLGVAHYKLPTSDHVADLQHATDHYEATLRVFTEDEFPWDWAGIQHNLGLVYSSLPTGDSAANLQHAINCFQAALRVRTEDEFPWDWARTQYEMGRVYWSLPTGSRDANLQQAIACHQATLRIYTEVNDTQQWADAYYKLVPLHGRIVG